MGPEEAVRVLLNDGIGRATKMLANQGGFEPYGRSLDRKLAINDIAARETNGTENTVKALQRLKRDLREKVSSGADIAIATFTNVVLRDGDNGHANAVLVGLEHAAGYSVSVCLPYSIAESGVIYGKIIMTQRIPDIFLPADC